MGQFLTRLGKYQLLLFHTFDGFGSLRFGNRAGAHGLGEFAAKSTQLLAVLYHAMT